MVDSVNIFGETVSVSPWEQTKKYTELFGCELQDRCKSLTSRERELFKWRTPANEFCEESLSAICGANASSQVKKEYLAAVILKFLLLEKHLEIALHPVSGTDCTTIPMAIGVVYEESFLPISNWAAQLEAMRDVSGFVDFLRVTLL